MNRFRLGTWLLTAWTALNLLVAVGVTASTLLGSIPPALQIAVPPSEIDLIPPNVVGVINAQALLANPCIIALCACALCIIHRGLITLDPWMWRTLASSLLFVQIFGYASDARIGGRNLVANTVSTLILVVGLAFSSSSPLQTKPLDLRAS